MASTGQTINDRLNAIKYALVGQGLARAVCKSTTEEVIGPKKKHIDYLIACTNEPNVSIPQLANLLIERTQHVSWTVVFKAMITIHYLMCFGNEKFTQFLATSNHSFNLTDFMDRTTPEGYSMSTFVRRYSKYVNDKCISYRNLAVDLCKIGKGNDNVLGIMNMDKLSKTLPIFQTQFDSLLEFAAEKKDLNNGIIMFAFRLLYRDLVKLYVAYHEAIMNLLERYFKLSRKKTREALELFKNYLSRMDKVESFLRVVDEVGLDKSEVPDVSQIASFLKTLEQHLAELEAKKRGKGGSASPEPADDAEELKENENPNQAGDKPKAEENLSPKVPTKKADSPDKPTTSTSIQQPPKPAPPQKPARPSPKASPEVSPAKPDPSISNQKSSPKPATTSTKVAPPSRPPKPPSRPPPPSGSGALPETANSSAGTSKPVTTMATKPPSPTPPPHPPPPTHPTKASTGSSSNVQEPIDKEHEPQQQEEQRDEPEVKPEPDSKEEHLVPDNQQELAEDDHATSICGIAANQVEIAVDEVDHRENVPNHDGANHNGGESLDNETFNHNETQPVAVEASEVRDNRVNQENHNPLNGNEDGMPSPPPPIDDVGEEPQIQNQSALGSQSPVNGNADENQ